MTKITGCGSDPDPLVRGIRIRIHPKMSWIRNTTLRQVGCGKGLVRQCLADMKAEEELETFFIEQIDQQVPTHHVLIGTP
jgi:hypothetical protein